MAYRRTILLINRPFQLRFSFYVVSWLFALSLIYPLIIYNIFEFLLKHMALDPMGPELAKLDGVRKEMVRLLVFLQLLFVVVTFCVSIFVSHRIAGPLYKLKKFLVAAKEGKLGELHFRKSDHFQDLAESFNEMADGIRATASSAAHHVEQAMKSSDSKGKGELEKALASLRQLSDKA